MATFRGNAGVISINTETAVEVMEFSVEETSAVTPDNVMGDAWDTHLPGRKAWTATISLRWDDTDPAQTEVASSFASGTPVAAIFYPEGTTATNAILTGTATVTSVGQNQGYENTTVMRNVTLTGTGSLVHDSI